MVGGIDAQPAETQIREMIDWYGNVAVPYARSAILQA
jgi:hypothetical protein